MAQVRHFGNAVRLETALSQGRTDHGYFTVNGTCVERRRGRIYCTGYGIDLTHVPQDRQAFRDQDAPRGVHDHLRPRFRCGGARQRLSDAVSRLRRQAAVPRLHRRGVHGWREDPGLREIRASAAQGGQRAGLIKCLVALNSFQGPFLRQRSIGALKCRLAVPRRGSEAAVDPETSSGQRIERKRRKNRAILLLGSPPAPGVRSVARSARPRSNFVTSGR